MWSKPGGSELQSSQMVLEQSTTEITFPQTHMRKITHNVQSDHLRIFFFRNSGAINKHCQQAAVTVVYNTFVK